ncbi:MAG: twin-arginine translocation signal domain-containing protein [Actinomycetota bacterium]
MAKEDKTNKKQTGLTRRDFLKVTAAAGAAGGFTSLLDTAVTPMSAAAYEITVDNNYNVISTCPYCSVGCNMKVGTLGGNVVDIKGDTDCVINKGALCSKGSAAIQLVNNTQRVGTADSVWTASRTNGPMKRTGNGAWAAIPWDNAMSEIAAAMVTARGAVPVDVSGRVSGSAKGVAFLGCSHATNEENWLYRKMIGNFGTNNTEHQARI